MKHIPQDIIEKILDNVSIVDVAGEYTTLQRAGVNFKGSCPFGHEDKNPSFSVSPARNICKCFSCGEGGNVITLVMKVEGLSFYDAVVKLAAKAGISLPEEDMTPEQEKTYKERESILAICEFSVHYFATSLFADTPEASIARQYAYDRWGEEFCREYGIGYASTDWNSFCDTAISKGYNTESLIKAGLAKERKDGNGIRDFFIGRLMIPVRDASGRVVSYTARIVPGIQDEYNEKHKAVKYLNTTNTPVFVKGSTIFGLDFARKVALQKHVFVLAEGAPDAIRLHCIGVTNAVASLGTEWSASQFRYLKRYADTFEFIPDSDPAKNGKDFGPGFESVFKNGKAAICAGFNVIVREIPLSEEKQDADSYFQSKEIYDSLTPVDFVLWFAEKKFAIATSPSKQTAVVKEVAAIVKSIPDKDAQYTYVKMLGEKFDDEERWRIAVMDEPMPFSIGSTSKQVDKPTEIEEYNSEEVLSEYGLERSGCRYYKTDDKNNSIELSNFIMKPVIFIPGKISSRIFLMKNTHGREILVEMIPEDMVGVTKFRQKCDSKGNYIWKGTNGDLTNLREFLYADMPEAERLSRLGWHSKGFYVYGNGILYDGKWMEPNELGIISVGNANYYLPSSSDLCEDDFSSTDIERRFIYKENDSVTLRMYTELIIKVYRANGMVALAFLIATVFKDVVTEKSNGFPILNIFGVKGSGKTELAYSIMAMVVVETDNTNLNSATPAALAAKAGSCANAPVHFDEYKNSLKDVIVEFIKGIWDGVGRARANKDALSKFSTTPVDSGAIITGQELATVYIAMFSRFVHLFFTKSEFTDEERALFDQLAEMREGGCTHLLADILKHRKKFETEYQDNFRHVKKEVAKILEGKGIEDRIFGNWIKVMASYRTLANVLDIPMGYDELRDVCVDGIIEQNSRCKTNSELGKFWHFVASQHQDNKIVEGSDFDIITKPYLTCRAFIEGKYQKSNKIKFNAPKKILYMRPERILAMYDKYSKQIDSMIPSDSLVLYLEHSPGYLGKAQKKFFIAKDGFDITKPVKEGSGVKSCKKANNETALCFDYEEIKDKFGISLEVSYVADSIERLDTDDEEEIEEQVANPELPF